MPFMQTRRVFGLARAVGVAIALSLVSLSAPADKPGGHALVTTAGITHGAGADGLRVGCMNPAPAQYRCCSAPADEVQSLGPVRLRDADKQLALRSGLVVVPAHAPTAQPEFPPARDPGLFFPRYILFGSFRS